MCCGKSPLHWLCGLLVVVGALNWGLVGLGVLMNAAMPWNVVNMLLGSWPMVEAVVYVLVGVAGLCKLFWMFKGCSCSTSGGMMK